jgi:hypothetical protein
VRKIQTDIQGLTADAFLEQDGIIEDKNVFNTLQVVRNYVEKYSVAEIKVDENAHRLIVIPNKPNIIEEEDLIVEERQLILKNELIEVSTIEDMGELRQDELEPEYLEECLEDLIDEDEECDNVSSTYFEVKDEVEDIPAQDIFAQGYEMVSYDSDASYKHSVSMSSESASDSKKSHNPRRPRNPENWLCNVRKTLRNSGQTYLSSTGKVMEARKMRESCGNTCRNKCITKITESDRKRAFDTFWGLGDVVKQRKWIYEHILSAEPKRRRTESSTRTVTLHFHLESQLSDGTDVLVQVCKKMFKNTLVVSSQVIQGVVKKYAAAGFNDSRGKFQRKLNPGQLFAVEHVKSFPFFYIEQTMTKVQCYQLYREECSEKGIDPVKEGNYRDIFDKQNQGSFLKSEKVQCEPCHRYFKASDEERASLHEEHELHINTPANKKCRDRALGRIRHQRATERKRAIRQAQQKKPQE